MIFPIQNMLSSMILLLVLELEIFINIRGRGPKNRNKKTKLGKLHFVLFSQVYVSIHCISQTFIEDMKRGFLVSLILNIDSNGIH